MISMQRILVPTDFSEPSQVALRYGKAFSESFGAELHLLHVVEDVMVSLAAGEGAGVVAPLALDEIEAASREQLAKLLGAGEQQRYRASVRTLRGTPSLEIVSYAKSEKMDVIIMGTHGRKPIAHMLMGSVAEKVVRKAPCPVLIVRHPEHDFVEP